VEYRANRYPVVTFTLMGVCVSVHLVIFALGLACGEGVYEWVYEYLWLIPAESRWWTYITSEGSWRLGGAFCSPSSLVHVLPVSNLDGLDQ
jgi:hypothetical protein